MKLSYRVFKVWKRDLWVWRRYMVGSLLANVIEPSLYLVAMGYGLGRFVQSFDGLNYAEFFAPAIIAVAVMQGATFETTYSSYTRMEVQKTFHGIAVTPISMEEVVAGEVLWAATKALFSSGVVFAVLCVAQLVHSPWVLLVPCAALCQGLMFASLGMLVTSFAKGYDFFSYYFTLVVAPMFLFSGTFFPLDRLPGWAKVVSHVSPLTYPVKVYRHLFGGQFRLEDALYMAGMLVVSLLVSSVAIRRLVKRLVI